MTAGSFLGFVCDARGLRGKARREALDRVVEWTAIGDVMHQPIGTLSKGYRRRVGLAQALVHDPPVLLLDEPTDGLDPNQKHDVRLLIKKLAPQKSIIISTHLLEEVDALCNRIVIIDRGRILVDSTPKELRKSEGDALDRVFRKLTTAHRPAHIAPARRRRRPSGPAARAQEVRHEGLPERVQARAARATSPPRWPTCSW